MLIYQTCQTYVVCMFDVQSFEGFLALRCLSLDWPSFMFPKDSTVPLDYD